jgi:hypothetical protein
MRRWCDVDRRLGFRFLLRRRRKIISIAAVAKARMERVIDVETAIMVLFDDESFDIDNVGIAPLDCVVWDHELDEVVDGESKDDGDDVFEGVYTSCHSILCVSRKYAW